MSLVYATRQLRDRDICLHFLRESHASPTESASSETNLTVQERLAADSSGLGREKLGKDNTFSTKVCVHMCRLKEQPQRM
jgi:hypothetical protein